MKKHKFRQETEAARGGAQIGKKNGPLITPIYQTSTFEVTDLQEQLRATPTDRFYTRNGNPTNTGAEDVIAELEGTDAALIFASGMAAISSSILSVVKAGDHIVAQRDIYGGTIKFLSRWLPKFGVETTFVDVNNIEQHETRDPSQHEDCVHRIADQSNGSRCRSGEDRRVWRASTIWSR